MEMKITAIVTKFVPSVGANTSAAHALGNPERIRRYATSSDSTTPPRA